MCYLDAIITFNDIVWWLGRWKRMHYLHLVWMFVHHKVYLILDSSVCEGAFSLSDKGFLRRMCPTPVRPCPCANHWFGGFAVKCFNWTCAIHSLIFMGNLTFLSNGMAALYFFYVWHNNAATITTVTSQRSTMEQPKSNSAGATKF